MHKLEFEKLQTYEPSDAGIEIDVTIKFVEASIKFPAKIDLGAAHCIFERRYGEQLGLDIESGMRQRFGTATGGFYAYGFRVTLITADFDFNSMFFSSLMKVLPKTSWGGSAGSIKSFSA